MRSSLRLVTGGLALLACVSCSAWGEKASLSTRTVSRKPRPASANRLVREKSPGSAEEPAKEVVEGSTVALGTDERSLTEALDRTLEMLKKEKTQNENLRDEVTSLRQQLAEKETELAEVATKLRERDTQLTKLEKELDKWKHNVIGFRDEMRQAEEAEIEVLQQVVALLKGFKREKELRKREEIQ